MALLATKSHNIGKICKHLFFQKCSLHRIQFFWKPKTFSLIIKTLPLSWRKRLSLFVFVKLSLTASQWQLSVIMEKMRKCGILSEKENIVTCFFKLDDTFKCFVTRWSVLFAWCVRFPRSPFCYMITKLWKDSPKGLVLPPNFTT